MRRRIVDVKIILLHIFAVIPLERIHAEQPFLQMRIVSVPECRRQTEQLKSIADAGNSVFAPAKRF